MRKWEIRKYTRTQLLAMLDTSDPDDPHRGNIPIHSLADLDDFS
jgi:hypothetical protein